MNKIFTVLSAILFSITLWAQAPQSFSYQAVVRGANNELVANKSVGMKISLLQGSETGAEVYVETHTPTSNANGLVSVAIGNGTKILGDFATIDWSKGPYFVKTETDPTGGTSYSLTNVSQLLSVPFALYAANSQPGPKGEKGDKGEAGKNGLDGKEGIQGPIGLTGPQGETGEQGLPGKDGVDGKNGLDGKEGIQGPIGLTGPQGDKGDQGLPGKDGKDGKNGVDGKDGLPGAQGIQGIQGPKGDTGATGAQGIQGDKGETGSQGVTGAQGIQGPTGLTGPKGDKGDTGATGAQGLKGDKGDQGIQGEKGDKGDQGIQGPTGLTGPKGEIGAIGPQGIQGEKGDKGETGAQGPIGLTGSQGLKGDKGDTGSQGATGIQGPIGLTGAKGEIGATGPQGIQGEKGDKGDQGIQGPIGLTGAKGETGATGPQGIQGIQGEKGDQGIQGPKGDTGLTGTQGPKGDTGLTGAQGPKGDTGLTGAQGIQGPKGDTGLTGAQGPKGDQGETGATGIQGPIGLTGPKGETGLQGIQGPKGDKGDQGNGFSNGTATGEMKYWDGTTWNTINPGNNGQGLTFCDGIPIWTTGGVCPGKVSSIDCSSATNNGTLTANTSASGVSSVIAYTGGNGGTHTGQTITSTGVTGLTATLAAGTFANGNGSLTYEISGTPSENGTASFEVNIGGKTCILTRNIITPTSGYGTNITDVDGNTYKTVYIGTQQWMGENLKTSKYSDGTTIPNITDNTQWQNNTTGAWAYYNNDAANNPKYGKLYNWYAVSKTTNGNKNVCPTGWHVPTDAEWTVLTDYLGGNSIAGGKMKEVGTTNWNSPNTSATNTSLFTGLPGGYRDLIGDYSNVGSLGLWWSSTGYNTYDAWSRNLDYYHGVAYRSDYGKDYGFSVRCLRD